MVYLESFSFPSLKEEEEFLSSWYNERVVMGMPTGIINQYPFNVLSQKGLESLDFEDITILYGGNGSGKSTALNAISGKLGLVRNSGYNKGNFFEDYCELCEYEEAEWGDKILLQEKSTLITSDDIFKYMLDTRRQNDFVNNRRDKAIDDWKEIRSRKIKHINFETGEGVDYYKQMKQAQKQTYSQYVASHVGEEIHSYSNGETGFMKFIESIVPDRLYILDEPENSLSCELQMRLAEYIVESVRFYGCLFIIATHSPFLLAIDRAKVYNLDGNPATISKFWELPNMKLYYELFSKFDRNLW
ncbi:MAG: AAA family ATPase [Paludibacteraceae bacterium]|nr:AAA family ATPase [Paludibacteraceae bacterium]